MSNSINWSHMILHLMYFLPTCTDLVWKVWMMHNLLEILWVVSDSLWCTSLIESWNYLAYCLGSIFLCTHFLLWCDLSIWECEMKIFYYFNYLYKLLSKKKITCINLSINQSHSFLKCYSYPLLYPKKNVILTEKSKSVILSLIYHFF
jgi:hypothetical protein